MLKKIPMLGLFFLLAAAVTLLPIACSSDNNGSDAAPDSMTSS
jgi:hypothetical protein